MEPDDHQAKAAGDDLLLDLGAAAGTRRIPDRAEAASLKPTCIADDRADASEDVFRRHARSVNVPPRLPSLDRMTALASRAEHLAQALLQELLPRRGPYRTGGPASVLCRAPGTS